jgi:hypothetical protein
MTQVSLGLEDLRPQGRSGRGGCTRRVASSTPCRHARSEMLHAYIDAVGIAKDRKGFLFRTSPGHNVTVLTEQPMKAAGKRLRIAPLNARRAARQRSVARRPWLGSVAAKRGW